MRNETDRRNMGLVYGDELAGLFGLPAEHAMALEPPLLGAALEIGQGAQGGHFCRLHLMVSSEAPLRMPEGDLLWNFSARQRSAPFAFIRQPDRSLRKPLLASSDQLANRAILRLADAPLSKVTRISRDKAGRYTSTALDALEREIVPGVDWFAMAFGCGLVATRQFGSHVVWVDSSENPTDGVLNLEIDPDRMIALTIPKALFDGMRPAIEAAQAADDADYPATPPPPVFDIVDKDGRLIPP